MGRRGGVCGLSGWGEPADLRPPRAAHGCRAGRGAGGASVGAMGGGLGHRGSVSPAPWGACCWPAGDCRTAGNSGAGFPVNTGSSGELGSTPSEARVMAQRHQMGSRWRHDPLRRRNARRAHISRSQHRGEGTANTMANRCRAPKPCACAFPEGSCPEPAGSTRPITGHIPPVARRPVHGCAHGAFPRARLRRHWPPWHPSRSLSQTRRSGGPFA